MKKKKEKIVINVYVSTINYTDKVERFDFYPDVLGVTITENSKASVTHGSE